MSLNLNKAIIAGNLTRDPQVKFLPNDKAVCDFSIAINRRYKTASGEQKEEATFVDVQAWGRTAELVGQYLIKGAGAVVIGELRMDSWEDKKTGEKRSKLKVVADSVQFLGGRKEHDQHGAEAAPAPARPQVPVAEPKPSDDEPPF